MSRIHLEGNPERPFLFLEETTSTNEELRRLATEGVAHGMVVCAARQTKGKGRHGRSWDSPAGNLYMSILLRPDAVVMPRTAELSLVAALACRDALDEAGIPGIQFKWPNDLLLKGRKFGGILLERAGDAVIVGMGINTEHYPEEAMFPATSLKVEGFAMPPKELMHLVLPDFERRYEEWHGRGFAAMREEWLSHAAHLNGKITVRLPDKAIEGIFRDITPEGALVLGTDEGHTTLHAGDVIFGKG